MQVMQPEHLVSADSKEHRLRRSSAVLLALCGLGWGALAVSLLVVAAVLLSPYQAPQLTWGETFLFPFVYALAISSAAAGVVCAAPTVVLLVAAKLQLKRGIGHAASACTGMALGGSILLGAALVSLDIPGLRAHQQATTAGAIAFGSLHAATLLLAFAAARKRR
jgi:hypothetical protein